MRSPHEDLIKTAVHVPAVRPFWKRFVYAGWNFGLVTEAVEKVTGVTLGHFVRERFLRPLGMSRTTLSETSAFGNVALGYAIDSDGSHHHVPFPQMDDELGMAGAYGAKSSVKDLLIMYRELLKAQRDQSRTKTTLTLGSPFCHAVKIFEPHIPVFASTNYCLGLYKTVLPGVLGIASLNSVKWLGLKTSPVFGAVSEGSEIWHHNGCMPAGSSTALLLPDSQSALVVLTNGVGLMNPTDFVAQQLLAVLVGEKPNKDLKELAKVARASKLAMYPKLHAALMKGCSAECARPEEAYEGHYWSAAGTLCLTVERRAGGGLRMRVQDVSRTGYDLVPYGGDTWWFPPNRKEELCQKDMSGFMHPGHHLVSFASSQGQEIGCLLWHHDHTTTKPEMFFRRADTPGWQGYLFPKPRL